MFAALVGVLVTLQQAPSKSIDNTPPAFTYCSFWFQCLRQVRTMVLEAKSAPCSRTPPTVDHFICASYKVQTLDSWWMCAADCGGTVFTAFASGVPWQLSQEQLSRPNEIYAKENNDKLKLAWPLTLFDLTKRILVLKESRRQQLFSASCILVPLDQKKETESSRSIKSAPTQY